MRILIVAEHASAEFGGEAMLPLHLYRLLRKRGITTWLLVHERTRHELEELFPDDPHILYTPDTTRHRLLWHLRKRLPERIGLFTVGFLMRLTTQQAQRRLARRLVREQRIDIVHQPIPVSPREPSLLYNLGAPVIIGPMNGGMAYPPAFRHMQRPLEQTAILLGRATSNCMNRLIPGKRKARLLLVANERTRHALPRGVSRHIDELVDNGVDLSLWPSPTAHRQPPSPGQPVRFVYSGRLVTCKAVDLLLEAFARACRQTPMTLTLAGDGPLRPALEQQARTLHMLADRAGEPGQVYFAGWLRQPDCADLLGRSDALVLPSLHECGGAVVLEAMASGLPAIAANWGGPADYLDPSCGILLEPTSRQDYVEQIERALVQLARAPALRKTLGDAGRAKVEQIYDWEAKIDRLLAIYQHLLHPGEKTA